MDSQVQLLTNKELYKIYRVVHIGGILSTTTRPTLIRWETNVPEGPKRESFVSLVNQLANSCFACKPGAPNAIPPASVEQWTDVLNQLNQKDVVIALKISGARFDRDTARMCKEDFVEHVVGRRMCGHKYALLSDIVKNQASKMQDPKRAPKRKRPISDNERQATTEIGTRRTYTGQLVPSTERYLNLPEEEEVQQIYSQYIAATSNEALAEAVCAVCARLLNIDKEGVREMQLDGLPNRHLLVPKMRHEAQDLYNDHHVRGMLLDPEGVISSSDHSHVVNVCQTCHNQLAKPAKDDLPPRLSLANGLWIGRTPEELSNLTLPESLLISHLYPRAFVVKLYPKAQRGYDPANLKTGLRGNVTTFEMDMSGIQDMLQGQIFPRPVGLLANVLSVTFVGKGRLPKTWLHRTFRVRREVVKKALLWLKANNKRYYGNITLDDTLLRNLPEDDVPNELIESVMQNPDEQLADIERAGYIPEHDVAAVDEILSRSEGRSSNAGGERLTDNDEDPDVIPLQFLGSHDNDTNHLSASELERWSFANLWREGKEGGYAVRHSWHAVNELGKTKRTGHEADGFNIWERAYPVLFPYGEGGIDVERSTPQPSFLEHVRWCLGYHDRRFRIHPNFIFHAFSSEQKRQALKSARVQMSRPSFEKDAQALSRLRVEDLQHAAEQEERGENVTNPDIKMLRRLTHATTSRVLASDASRTDMRSKIWGTILIFGPPTLWITINPEDINSPIAQLFAGRDIDMDKLEELVGMTKQERISVTAADPYASASFFHLAIQELVLETLFKIKSTPFSLNSGVGVLGKVSSYIGLVESQGRGMLHTHMLIWLQDTPNPDELARMYQTEEFREKVIHFLKRNIRAYHPQLATDDMVKDIPMDPHVGFERPLDPCIEDYDKLLMEQQCRVVRTTQIHKCTPARCLRLDKHGKMSCRRKFPVSTSDAYIVTERGTYEVKRTLNMMNAWNPAISETLFCNNDIKMLTNGRDTSNITFYVSTYATKKQGRSYNASAVAANAFKNHTANVTNDDTADFLNQNRKLLFRVMNAMAKEQELAGPMVVSYLMGWNHIFVSHRYANIYWSTFMGALYRAFPQLRPSANSGQNLNDNDTTGAVQSNEGIGVREQQLTDTDGSLIHEPMRVEASPTGQIVFSNQLIDYTLRSPELEDMNILNYFVDTYEQYQSHRGETSAGGADGEEQAPDLEEQSENLLNAPSQATTAKRRRLNQNKFQYQVGHPKRDTVWRVVRREGHSWLPNFIGRYFAKRKDEDQREIYCASMLMLLKPWRKFEDLLSDGGSFAEKFDEFMHNTSHAIAYQHVLGNIEYYHQCSAAADKDKVERALQSARSTEQDVNFDTAENEERRRTEDRFIIESRDEANYDAQVDIEASDEKIALAWYQQVAERERHHGQHAVLVANMCDVFGSVTPSLTSDGGLGSANLGSANDASKVTLWQEHLASQSNQVHAGPASIEATAADDNGRVEAIRDLGEDEGPTVTLLESEAEPALEAIDISHLFPEQRRAYDIVHAHLQAYLAGESPRQLLMQIQGEGGTGKSKVIQCVTATFNNLGVSRKLTKAAFTGIAASLINGRTIHTLVSLTIDNKDDTVSTAVKRKIGAVLHDVEYLIIDESSMVSASLFSELSRRCQLGKAEYEPERGNLPFGGLNVILCGDFHQFPPVLAPKEDLLYYVRESASDAVSIHSMNGHNLYRLFTDVVILRQQVRVQDPIWRDFLTRLRQGAVALQDLAMLDNLVLEKIGARLSASTVLPNFEMEPWSCASLVTPRHAVKNEWNKFAVRADARRQNQQLYICRAIDTHTSGQMLDKQQQLGIANMRGFKGRRLGDLRGGLMTTVEIFVGMKVMVTTNVDTELDIANGARGEVVGITLDKEEPPIDPMAPEVQLTRLPTFILVKLQRTKAAPLPGLGENVIPVFPRMKTFKFSYRDVQGEKQKMTARRRQFPLTAAYAFTDYRSQGQTLPCVIVDIKKPPSGSLTIRNVYVALSRSSGRDTIRLLRDFDRNILLQANDDQLKREDTRLESLDGITKAQWNASVQ